MDTNFRIITDQSYAPGCFILQRTRAGAFEDYRDYQNPRAEQDTVLFQADRDFPSLALDCGWKGTYPQTEAQTAESIEAATDYLSKIAGDSLPEARHPALAEYFGDANDRHDASVATPMNRADG
ncbi:MAG: hypothetical protein ACP5QA_13060 [Phycisphaerae bacterium]